MTLGTLKSIALENALEDFLSEYENNSNGRAEINTSNYKIIIEEVLPEYIDGATELKISLRIKSN